MFWGVSRLDFDLSQSGLRWALLARPTNRVSPSFLKPKKKKKSTFHIESGEYEGPSASPKSWSSTHVVSPTKFCCARECAFSPGLPMADLSQDKPAIKRESLDTDPWKGEEEARTRAPSIMCVCKPFYFCPSFLFLLTAQAHLAFCSHPMVSHNATREADTSSPAPDVLQENVRRRVSMSPCLRTDKPSSSLTFTSLLLLHRYLNLLGLSPLCINFTADFILALAKGTCRAHCKACKPLL